MVGVRYISIRYFLRSVKMERFGSMKLNSPNLKTRNLFQKEQLRFNFLSEKLK